MRRGLWEVSSLARVRSCGRVTHTDAGGPTLRLTEGESGRTAGLAGLVSCGSVWACPCCARKIGARRADELRHVVSAAAADGGSAALITLTLRHNAGHRLAQGWDALRYAWSRVTSGKAYQRERDRWGIVGWANAVEVTHGDQHGWHPHVHVLVVFDGPVSDDLIAELAGRWFARWERALTRKGFSAVEGKGGLDARPVSMTADSSGALGAYLAKIAYEVTGGSAKVGRDGNRSPFAILRDGLATGLADDIERWWEWEKASHGRRQLTWSHSLREHYGLRSAQTDEEIAAEDMRTDDLIALPAPTWDAVRDRAELLLGAAEVGGLDAACRWLDARGLAWTWVTAAPPRDRTALALRAPRLPVGPVGGRPPLVERAATGRGRTASSNARPPGTLVGWRWSMRRGCARS